MEQWEDDHLVTPAALILLRPKWLTDKLRIWLRSQFGVEILLQLKELS